MIDKWAHFCWWMRKRRENFTIWVAFHLPRYLVMWCAVRLMAHATTGQWGHEEPGKVNIIEALSRWNIKHEATRLGSCKFASASSAEHEP